MSSYIFGKRNSIHIIDIRETVKGLLLAKKFVTAIVAQGQDILFVGTKRQARESVIKVAGACGMHYVSERWLGGSLTNFSTIRSRLARLEYLEKLNEGDQSAILSKKDKSRFDREREKITRNLEGMRKMTRLPGAIVVVDVTREHNAVKEARKLNIPTIALVDTDSNPDVADIIIPGNDDSMRGIELVLSQLGEAIEAGKRGRTTSNDGDGDKAGGAKPRRSRRMTTSEMAAREGMRPSESGDEGPVEAMVSGSSHEQVAPPSEVTDNV